MLYKLPNWSTPELIELNFECIIYYSNAFKQKAAGAISSIDQVLKDFDQKPPNLFNPTNMSWSTVKLPVFLKPYHINGLSSNACKN